jgi:hypothetical protein
MKNNDLKPDVPKTVLLQPNNVIAFHSVELGIIITNVVECEDYTVHTRTPGSDIGIPIINWYQSLQKSKIIISPN